MPASKKRRPLIGKAATGGYQPIDQRWFNRPRDLPPFTFLTVQAMLIDPTIRLGLAMREAPLCAAEIAYKDGDKWVPGIKADDPSVAAFVANQLERIWSDVSELLKAQRWGWSACEVLYRLSHPSHGRRVLEVDRLLPRHPNDTRALVCEGEAAGVRFLRIVDESQGHVDLPFPKAVFHAHAPDPGAVYGTSILQGAYSPWADKWLNGGALDVRRLFMHKDAYRGASLRYPNEIYEIEGKGTVPARDIAREAVEQIKTGGVTTFPSDYYDGGTNPKWELKETTVASNPQHILQYPKDLDVEMLRGMECPDDVFTAEQDTSGAWNGKMVPMQAFYTGLDIWLTKLLKDLKRQLLDHLVAMNYGPGKWYEVTAKPLGLQAMELQKKTQPEQPKQFGGFNRDGDGDGFSGEDRQQLPQRMSLEQVGRGDVEAVEVVTAVRAALDKRLELKKTAGDDDSTVTLSLEKPEESVIPATS